MGFKFYFLLAQIANLLGHIVRYAPLRVNDFISKRTSKLSKTNFLEST